MRLGEKVVRMPETFRDKVLIRGTFLEGLTLAIRN